MIKHQHILILLFLNFLILKSKVLYVLCGLLFIPSVSQAISNALQILWERLYPIYNSIQRKYLHNFPLLAPPFQSAQKISFAGNEQFAVNWFIN